MDYFDEQISPREKLIQIMQNSSPAALDLACDELFLRLLACEALLAKNDISNEDIIKTMNDPSLEDGLNDIYIGLMAKILSCE